MKVIRAKRHAKMKNNPPESVADNESSSGDHHETEVDNTNQVIN